MGRSRVGIDFIHLIQGMWDDSCCRSLIRQPVPSQVTDFDYRRHQGIAKRVIGAGVVGVDMARLVGFVELRENLANGGKCIGFRDPI